ncbi:hypothetical protein AAG906_016141 [Vitis piasezkii]
MIYSLLGRDCWLWSQNRLYLCIRVRVIIVSNMLQLIHLSAFRSCDDIFEPKLDELITQLREIGGELDHWLSDRLTCRLSSLSSPDDLLNFFSDLRGILAGPDSGVVVDDQIMLDSNSNLGVLLRRCILAFNLLSFEETGCPSKRVTKLASIAIPTGVEKGFIGSSLGSLMKLCISDLSGREDNH